MPGVAAASVSLTLEQAEVQYGEGLCTPEQLVAAVEAAGFEATGGRAGRGDARRSQLPLVWAASAALARAAARGRGLLRHYHASQASSCLAMAVQREVQQSIRSFV